MVVGNYYRGLDSQLTNNEAHKRIFIRVHHKEKPEHQAKNFKQNFTLF